MSSFIVKKAVDTGVGYGVKTLKTTATNQATEYGKSVVFGQGTSEVGDKAGKFDFRGQQMFTDPKPTGIVSVFYGSRVIKADDLDLILQAQKGFQYKDSGGVVVSSANNDVAKVQDDKVDAEVGMGEKDTNDEPVTDDKQKGDEKLAPQVPQSTTRTTSRTDDEFSVAMGDKNFKSSKTVNKPITMADIRSMVDFKEGETNKGYVRFVMTNKGKGVKLGKVGDWCGVFMSRRINVTKEHNRQLRNLFAETMLHDFGAVDGLGPEEKRKEQFGYYGQVLEGKLNDIRAALLKTNLAGNRIGDMVGRMELKSVIETFDSMFTKDGLDGIVSSYLDECLTQIGFKQKGTLNNVDDFLKRYGKYSGLADPTAAGIRAMFNFNDEQIEQLKNGDTKLLLGKLNDVRDAFIKMKTVFSYEHKVEEMVDNWAGDQITIQRVSQTHVENIKGVFLNRLNDELSEDVKVALTAKDKGFSGGVNGVLSLYFKDAFDKIQDVYRDQFKKTNVGDAKDALKEKIRNALSYENVYASVKNFIEEYSKAVKSRDLLAINDLFAHLEKRINDAHAKIADDLKEKGMPSSEDMANFNKLLEEYGQLQDIKRELGTVSQDLRDKIKNTDLLKGDDKKVESNAGVKPNENEAVEADHKRVEGDEGGETGKVEEKGSNEQPQKPVKAREWTQNELIKVIKDGSKTLDEPLWDAVFVENFLMDNFGKEGFQKNNEEIQKKFDLIFQDYEKKVSIAINQNVASADDMNVGDFVVYFSGEIAKQVDVDALKNDFTTKIDKFKSSDDSNNKTTTLKTFIEGMVRATVDYLVDKKGKDSNFTIMGSITDLTDKTNVLAGMLSGQIDDFLSGDVKGLKSFVSAGKVYTYKGAVAADENQGAKNEASYVKSAKEYIYVDLIRDFLEYDVPGLLAVENLEDLKKQAQEMFKLRANEVFSKMENTKNGEFYSAILEFKTKVDLNDEGMMSLVKDKNKKTGYTGTDIVPRGFRSAEAALKLDADDGPIKKRDPQNSILSDEDLIIGLKKHSEELWRGEIVKNAPGKSCFEFFDFLKFKFNNWVGRSNFVDISADWIKARQEGYTKSMNAYVKNCIAFETQLKTAFTREIRNALKARLGNDIDGKHVDKLVAPILTGYKPQMEALFKRYIAVPDFHKAGKGLFNNGDENLTKLVRNALGFDMYKEDYKGSDSFDENYEKSRDEILKTLKSQIIAERDGVNQEVKTAMLSRIMEKGPKNIVNMALSSTDSEASNVITVNTLKRVVAIDSFQWAIRASVDKAMSNPIATYEKDSAKLNEKLANWAANSLKRVSKALLGKKVTELLESCSESVAEACKNGLPADVQSQVENRLNEYVGTFVGALCDIVSRSGKTSDEKVDKLIEKTLVGFEGYVARMKKMLNDKKATVWLGYTTVFQSQVQEGVAALVAKGATAEMLAQFVLDCETKWHDDVDKSTETAISESVSKGTLENGNTFNEISALATKIEKYTGLRDVTKKYTDVLDGNTAYCLNMTGMKTLLAQYGLSEANYPEREVYESVLETYLTDDRVVAFFAQQQMASLNDVTVGMKDEFDKFIKDTLVPNFKMAYQVKSMRAAVEKRIASIEAKKNESANDKKALSSKMGDAFAKFDTEKAVTGNIDKLKEDLKALDRVPLGLDSNVKVLLVTKEELNKGLSNVASLSQDKKNRLEQGQLSVFKERVNKVDPDVLFVVEETLKEIQDKQVDLNKIRKDQWVAKYLDPIVARFKLIAPDAFDGEGSTDNMAWLKGVVFNGLSKIVENGDANAWTDQIKPILNAEQSNVSPAKEDCENFSAGLWDRLQDLGNRSKMKMKGAANKARFISESVSTAIKELEIADHLQKRFWDDDAMPWHWLGKNTGNRAEHLELLKESLDPIEGNFLTMLKNLRSVLDDENLVQKIYSDPQKRNNDVTNAKNYIDGIVGWYGDFEKQLREKIEGEIKFDDNKGVHYLKRGSGVIGESVWDVNKNFLPKVVSPVMHQLLDGYLLHLKTTNNKKV